MILNQRLKSYLIIFAYLVIGLLIMGTAKLIKVPHWLNSSIIILVLFVFVNIITGKLFRLKNELNTFWSPKKIIFLPLGAMVGGVIGICPVLIGLLAGEVSSEEITLKTTYSVSSVAFSLIIVSWEELWFRGIILNYCRKYLSATNISITIGLLFMLVHILNPQIDLLKIGPTLFFAGAFLTIVYFYFKTIWLPIGLHFGNNYFALETEIEKHWLLGNEAYLSGFILAGLFFIFVILTMKKQSKINKVIIV